MAEEIRNQLLIQDEDTEFDVEKVKDIRIWGGKLEYLVKWANTPIESNATLASLSPYFFPKKDGLTFEFNKTSGGREIVWPDEWIPMIQLDCPELIMQFHLDEKNGLKNQVATLKIALDEVKEENARLKMSNESLKACVTAKKRKAVVENKACQTEDEETSPHSDSAGSPDSLEFASANDESSFSMDCVVEDYQDAAVGKKAKIGPSATVFQCGSCTMCYEHESSLRRHSLLHKGRDFPCEKCYQTFTRKDNLKRHQANGYCNGDAGGNSAANAATAEEKEHESNC